MPGAVPTTPVSDLPEPRRAIVVPRGRWADSSARLPLEQMVSPFFKQRVRGVVRITAPPGGGKTTAVRHLLAVLPEVSVTSLVDDKEISVAYGVNGDRPWSPPHEIQLCPWTLDDCMEYLCAVHRGRCSAVLARLKADSAIEKFAGCPQLLTMVMDAMALDPLLPAVRDVCRCELLRLIPRGTLRDDLPTSLDAEQRRWWRHEVVQHIVRADWIVEELTAGRLTEPLADMGPPDLIAEIAAAAADRPQAIDRLHQLVRDEPTSISAPMAVSILIQMDRAWRPVTGRKLNLHAADLRNARWSGVDLRESLLTNASLAGADLTEANLASVNAMADFTGAVLRGAKLAHVQLQKSNLRCADLANAFAPFADLSEVDLEAAELSGANFADSQLIEANLENANCERANFNRATLRLAKLDQADFQNACFDDAKLLNLDMSAAIWVGASFVSALLSRCNLEGIDLPNANFKFAKLTASLFTGSFMPNADFHGADLRHTGLADVDWENVDLRDADLTDASFHMGSTRSGLVGSTIAGEGSRTGFYTDDFTEMNFKSPEEIRKANLRGANLLGAKVEGTDFYLVDLRDARYSPDQESHFRRCGAILTEAEE
jgi:uncharacterized protein YjbI with pentapeptide repeats